MLGSLAAGSAALGAPAGERYRLGVMAAMYSSLPVEEAMARIRKAGYRYISIGPKHGADVPVADRRASRFRGDGDGLFDLLADEVLTESGERVFRPAGERQKRGRARFESDRVANDMGPKPGAR